MTISKNIKFDCAHILSEYQGKCGNLHGHTYHGTVTLIGDVKSETSMLLDYNVIKDRVDVLDHAVIFGAPETRNTAETELFKWAVTHDMRYVELAGGKSTAENIANWIVAKFLEFPNIKGVQVTLSETDGSYVTAEGAQ